MKRYELAKNAGMPWEVVLITDAETDLKVLIRDCVIRGENLSIVNGKVVDFIKKTVDKLENEELKAQVRNSFPTFATKLYYEWLTVFGTQTIAIMFLTALKAQKTAIPKRIEDSLKSLPKTRLIGDFEPYLNDSGYNRAIPNGQNVVKYEKEIQERINTIAGMSAKTNYASRYSIRASAEIAVRYEHNQRQISSLRDKGVRLAWIDSHANCSERCKHWQGRLYSLTGEVGEIDGVKYVPLEEATEVIDEYGYRNGCLSGFNCRHKLIPYKKGFRPQEIPESVMKRQRELEQKQRYMERNVRQYETRALLNKASNKKLYKHYKELAKKWTDKYEDFSRKNKIPFYPSRLDI